MLLPCDGRNTREGVLFLQLGSRQRVDARNPERVRCLLRREYRDDKRLSRANRPGSVMPPRIGTAVCDRLTMEVMRCMGRPAPLWLDRGDTAQAVRAMRAVGAATVCKLIQQRLVIIIIIIIIKGMATLATITTWREPPGVVTPVPSR